MHRLLLAPDPYPPLFLCSFQVSPGLGSRCLTLIDVNRNTWNAVISDAVAGRSSDDAAA
jgi:hypothetical protein